MPDIDEGLEIGGEPVISREEGDVNTQSGFEAGIARALTGEAAAPEEGEGEAAPEEEEVQAPEAPEGPAPEEPEDNWRERYEEAQKLIDRQGNELGALRAQVQEIWSAQQAPQTPSTGPFNAEAMLDEYGGQQTIHWAIDSAPEHIEEVARAWALSGDPEGAVFYADYRAEQARLEYTQAEQQQPEPDPALNEVAQERKLVQVFKEAREHDPGFSSYEPGIPAALQSTDTPDEIKLMLMSGNLDHMRAGVRHLIPYARLAAIDAGTATQTPSAEPPAEATPQEEARREAARKTAIVTGSQRLQAPGEQPTSGEMTSEQRIARFKEQFDAEPDTSIAAGLTINGQPVLPQRPKRPA